MTTNPAVGAASTSSVYFTSISDMDRPDHHHFLAPRLYSSPPTAQSRLDSNPTLLVCWWATGFALAIIVVRVCGRYVRSQRLFKDDWVALASAVPLLIRMGLVHVVLVFQTNNTTLTSGFTERDIRRREIGSRVVLVARIFYALFIWTAKFTVLEFLMRITSQIWNTSFHRILRVVRYFLAITFAGVVVAALTECRPFSNFWQVTPDPGPKCRQGFAHLITMGVCDIVTDLLLVIFPIPILHLSVMPMRRKLSLMILFALSIITAAITSFRIPTVIERHGSQQYRSLIASLEILAAAAVSNALVIGSYVRDRGVKKQKFKFEKFGSVSESQPSSSRRPTPYLHQWGSDADLAGGVGMRLDPKLSAASTAPGYAAEYETIRTPPRIVPANRGSIDRNWQFPSPTDDPVMRITYADEYIEPESPKTPIEPSLMLMTSRSTSPTSRMSIADPGGLLERQSHTPVESPFLRDVGGLLRGEPASRTSTNPSSLRS